jgi:hypothetical protein
VRVRVCVVGEIDLFLSIFVRLGKTSQDCEEESRTGCCDRKRSNSRLVTLLSLFVSMRLNKCRHCSSVEDGCSRLMNARNSFIVISPEPSVSMTSKRSATSELYAITRCGDVSKTLTCMHTYIHTSECNTHKRNCTRSCSG